MDMMKIQVILENATLQAVIDDTRIGRDFLSVLPLDLELSDYHGMEKVADLPRQLDTTDAPRSYTPKPGDITLYAPWGNMAIFYKSFGTTAGLVRLGAFDGSIEPLLKTGPYKARFQRAE